MAASPSYVSIAQSNYTDFADATYPYQNYIGPVYVVSEVVFSDPSSDTGATFNQQFNYYAAWVNVQGRGFSGFYYTQMTDSRTGLSDYEYYWRFFPYIGMNYAHYLQNGTAYIDSSAGTFTDTVLDSTVNNQRYFTYFNRWLDTRDEFGGTENGDEITQTATSWTYDNYGNALTIAQTVTDEDPNSPYTGKSWTTSTTNSPDVDANPGDAGAPWCLTMVDETQVTYSSTLSGSTSVTRTKEFTPDTPSACRIKGSVTERTANGGLYAVTEALTFDSFGNVATDTVTGATMPSSPASRETQMNWGTTGQFLNTLTDPSNAKTTWTYTSNQALTFGLYENLYYDADNRLCAAAVGGTGSCSSSTIVYDGGNPGPGNITNQPGVGTYTYPAVGQPRPHAVSSITGTFNGITNPNFSYDLNGNMTARASSSQNIIWFSYNYPASISATDVTGSEEVQFSYGPDRQRWKQIYTGPSGTEETYYVGNGKSSAPAQLEVVFNGTSTNYRHYIYAGAEPVAVYSRTSAGATMSYMLEDHQGGVSAIISNAGAADIDESMSAFGQRRNATTWSGPPTAADLNTMAGLTRQGYTFQTWLGQSMGLNHMNGRVQDAILGRFLSADPNIPDPTNAQSYNRYSYANSNPLTLIDPTGFDDSDTPLPPGILGADWLGAASTTLEKLPEQNVVGDNSNNAIPDSPFSILGSLQIVSSASSAPAGFNAYAPLAKTAQSQSGSFNDPNLFNPPVATNQTLSEITVTGSIATPPSLLPLTPSFYFPSFGTTDYGGFTPRVSPSNFIRASGAFVATTATLDATAGAVYAFGELAEVTTTGIGVDFGGTILLSVGALSDVGGMAAVGSTVGAAGGVVLLPALGVGWEIGTLLNPYVQPIISSWYGY